MTPIIPDGPKKRYLGQYPGRVENVTDPQGLMRVQVRVHPLFKDVPTASLPWAEYLLPIGARPGNGIFCPVRVNDWVWVDFPYMGDSRRPRIVGSIHHCPGQAPNLPHDAWDGPDRYEHHRAGSETPPVPPSYHDGACVLDENGVLLEIGADGAVRATHKASGSSVEICADGKITIHGSTEINVSSGSNTNVIVGQDANVIVGRDVSLAAGRNIAASCKAASVSAETEAAIVAPAIRMRGLISAADVGDGAGQMTLLGNMLVTGNIDVVGNIGATGRIRDGAGNTNHHIHWSSRK